MLATGPGVFPSGGLGYHLEPDAGVDSEVDAVKRVRQLVERGVDVIKIVSADGPEPLGQEWTIFPTRGRDPLDARRGDAHRPAQGRARDVPRRDRGRHSRRHRHGRARLVPDRAELPHDARARRLPDPDGEQHLGDHPQRPGAEHVVGADGRGRRAADDGRLPHGDRDGREDRRRHRRRRQHLALLRRQRHGARGATSTAACRRSTRSRRGRCMRRRRSSARTRSARSRSASSPTWS